MRMANRQVKDSVFRKLFNNRRELAKLYQAILKTDTPVLPQDLKITTYPPSGTRLHRPRHSERFFPSIWQGVCQHVFTAVE